MNKTCIAIRHVAFEDLGILGPLLKKAGYQVEYRDAGSFKLSDLEWLQADLVVVLGGPLGVYEVDEYPWLVDEVAGLGRRLQAERPTLGICLGAQLMAAALGAGVFPGPTKEIGWGGLTLTDAGAASALRCLGTAPVLHWHGDTFDLPAGATLLASTEQYRCQAFAIGDYCLALQFHLEVAPSSIEAWLIGHAVELSQARVSPTYLRKQSAALGEEVVEAGRAVLAHWLHQQSGSATASAHAQGL